MKKKTPPRLTLKRETIRQLEQPNLHMAVGGVPTAGPTQSVSGPDCSNPHA